MSSDPLIKVEGLSKCYHIFNTPRDRLLQMLARGRRQFYREFWALREVSFSIGRGETVGIIGRNGSGKSTLLQIICGTLRPTSGTVETRGRIAALLELGAGFNPEFTGRENVYLNGAILGLPRAEIDSRFDDIAAFADIGDYIDQPVKTYSSGMFARLAFAVYSNVDADILIVDEALAVGDARFQAKCMKRIKTIREDGATVLFVSHDVSSVRTLCERAIWLDAGRLMMAGDVFPVTGCFMEYMLEGEKSEPVAAALPALECETPINAAPETAYDSKPVTHWGSHLGCIKSAGLFARNGERAAAFEIGEEMEVRIAFKTPRDAKPDYLTVAFSIKDLKGSDLIVSSTSDWERYAFNGNGGSYLVRFRFKNPLVPGRYFLVAAIEDRSSPAIHYYEYIEGAHYFSSMSKVRLFGIFQPEIQQEVIETHGGY